LKKRLLEQQNKTKQKTKNKRQKTKNKKNKKTKKKTKMMSKQQVADFSDKASVKASLAGLTQQLVALADAAGYVVNKKSGKLKSKASAAVAASKPSEEEVKYAWSKGTGYGHDQSSYDWDVDGFESAKADKPIQAACVNLAAEIQKAFASANQERAELITQALHNCFLVQFLAAYMKNDSLVDMERHAELYLSVLQMCKVFAGFDCASSLLLVPLDRHVRSNAPTLLSLMSALRSHVETVSQRQQALLEKQAEKNKDAEESFTARVIESIKQIETQMAGRAQVDRDAAAAFSAEVAQKMREDPMIHIESKDVALAVPAMVVSESKDVASPSYAAVMGPLQFAEVDKGFQKHQFLNEAPGSLTRQFIRRVACEFSDLSRSLPLTEDSSVFVRVDPERLQYVQMMITAPMGTPYAGGCFLFDVFLPANYPNVPPKCNLQTTGHGSVRFNPNLYDSGYVCLSLLGTWSGQSGETWMPNASTLLQLAVSIQSLIFVAQPYFNEPSYESEMGTSHGDQASKQYNTVIRAGTLAHAMIDQLKNPPVGFEEVVRSHFALRRQAILQEVAGWESDKDVDAAQVATLKDLLNELPMPAAPSSS